MEIIVNKSTVEGHITAPASKSFAQRAIAAALLADGVSTLRGVDQSQDTQAALAVARQLGATITPINGDTYTIQGGGIPQGNTTIYIGESGLSTRLFTPISALAEGAVTVEGTGSILSRPMDFIKTTLQSMGALFESTNGFLPLRVQGPIHGGRIEADGAQGSQFITGLLFALPLATQDSELIVSNLQSHPYVNMTLDVLREFGVEVENEHYKTFRIKGGQSYKSGDYTVEGDWSGASCPLVAGATCGEVTIGNLNRHSRQADRAIIEVLSGVGAHIEWTDDTTVRVSRLDLRHFMFDATHCPDLFPALAALAAACDGTSQIIGTDRLIHKESNRALTIQQELGRLGIEVDLSIPNMMRIHGNPSPHGGRCHSHGDHRIAMALAVSGLRASGTVHIEQAESVEKSYPAFWDDFARYAHLNR